MKFKKVVVGGSFDHLHKGHKALLEKAFELGEKVIIGLTSDEMVNKPLQPYGHRKKRLEEYLSNFNYELIKLNDPYGIAVEDPEVDAIVVSEETLERAKEINQMRNEKGLKRLEVIVVPIVLAEDGKPISSTRIRKGEINADGEIIREN
jgi:pantetheine-phosphate adenylyltransferase